MTIRTSVPGIEWPGIPSHEGAALLALQFQLERSQWMAPEELQGLQLQQAWKLLAHAARTVPFYEESLAGPDSPVGGDVSMARWQTLPLLRRAELQAAGDSVFSTALPDAHGEIADLTTTGSTGQPVTVRTTGVVQHFWRALTLREHLWHRRDLGGTLAAIRFADEGLGQPPDGTIANGWGVATDSVYHAGRSALLSIQTSTEEQLAWLETIRPDYLLTFPSNARSLAERCVRDEQRLEGLKELRTIGEAVSTELRTLAREAWGVPVIANYSAQETGYLGLACPENPTHYHVQSESVLLEVLDETGQPCAPGEVGQVVATTLQNFATPLIRYEIGDMARVGAPCGCGRGLPVLDEVLGRVRNMVTLPNGTQHWPFMGEKRYRDHAPVIQFQLVQKSLARIELRLVVERDLTKTEETQIAEIVREELRYPFEVEFSYHERIPRGAGGKFEDFVSELEATP